MKYGREQETDEIAYNECLSESDCPYKNIIDDYVECLSVCCCVDKNTVYVDLSDVYEEDYKF